MTLELQQQCTPHDSYRIGAAVLDELDASAHVTIDGNLVQATTSQAATGEHGRPGLAAAAAVDRLIAVVAQHKPIDRVRSVEVVADDIADATAEP